MAPKSIQFLAFAAVAALPLTSFAAEVEIPRSVAGDKGRYYLLEMKRSGPITTVLHKRVGPSGTSHTRTEINCAAQQMRVVGEAEEDPSKMRGSPTKWFDLVEGSSKSDLFRHVCKK
jgi:hypothetical protein